MFRRLSLSVSFLKRTIICCFGFFNEQRKTTPKKIIKELKCLLSSRQVSFYHFASVLTETFPVRNFSIKCHKLFSFNLKFCNWLCLFWIGNFFEHFPLDTIHELSLINSTFWSNINFDFILKSFFPRWTTLGLLFFPFVLLQSKVMIVLFKLPAPPAQVHNEQHTIMWFSPFLIRLIARHQRKGKSFNKMVIFK